MNVKISFSPAPKLAIYGLLDGNFIDGAEYVNPPIGAAACVINKEIVSPGLIFVGFKYVFTD
jgi:hypothetical protein